MEVLLYRFSLLGNSLVYMGKPCPHFPWDGGGGGCKVPTAEVPCPATSRWRMHCSVVVVVLLAESHL